MIKYYLKTAVRSLLLHKKIFFISIFGQSISIAVALFIFSYVYFERSYDDFHEKADRIYRIESDFYDNDVLTASWGTSSFGYASAMKENLPGIEDFVRMSVHEKESEVSIDNIVFRETAITSTESSFFDVFSVDLVEGDQLTALKGPNKVVITKSTSKKYFKDDNPLGKVLKFRTSRQTFECEITGVIEDFRKNSHIDFDFLVSYETLPRGRQNTWYLHEAYSYLLLEEGRNPEDLEKAFPEMSEKYKTRSALKNKKWGITLNPLTEIHLSPQKLYESETKGNKTSLAALLFIAISVLIIAGINYINLTTANALKRAKEIAVRKVNGSSQKKLILQFLTEAFVQNICSLFVASIIIIGASASLMTFMNIKIDFSIFSQFQFWIYTILGFFVLSLLSGIYPSIILSTFKPTTILKGKLPNTGKAGIIRKGLISLQFTASIILICSSVLVAKQINYMSTKPLGININQKMVVHFPGNIAERQKKVATFKYEIEKINGVESVSVSSAVPGMEAGYFFAASRPKNEELNQSVELLSVDEGFASTYDLNIIEGRYFRDNPKAERKNILLNETALTLLGFESAKEAIGQKVNLEGQDIPGTIIGVVKNYHQQSLTKNYPPLVFIFYNHIGWIPQNTISIKLSAEGGINVIEAVNEKWTEIFPDNSFDTFFVDSFFESQYEGEKKFLVFHSLFTIIAILIALIGLGGQIIFENNNRIKEIGIRKINGASTLNILFNINVDFIKWISYSIVIAIPLAYFLMQNWLSNFAFKTEISWWIFALAGSITLFIVLLTVSWQSWRAATRNPVEALRSE